MRNILCIGAYTRTALLLFSLTTLFSRGTQAQPNASPERGRQDPTVTSQQIEELPVRRTPQVLNLCDLVENWKNYHSRKVRVRAIYRLGAGAWLYDPTCRNGEALTDVSFQEHPKGATKRLEQIAAKDRRVWVILEGTFYGPEPFNNIDPKLPAKLREALEKSHKRYGHMDSFETMISVTRVVEAAEVSDDVPASKS
jgi:hypothetical protein